ncbi:hypothetical protein [Janthinobacterium sp. CG_23.4]|nr:hypothetical protein [Janthinobacterium sp. CG_23.4]MDH6158082.1 hypothetical protein [Janthinobacterium sp. CG_23.4]
MARENKYSGLAEKSFQLATSIKLAVSFEHVDWDDDGYFFLHGLNSDYYVKLFECITDLQKSTEDEIVQQTHSSLKAKSIFNTKNGLHNKFPDSTIEAVVAKLIVERPDKKDLPAVTADAKKVVSRAFEVRLGTNWGRIHGFVWDKVFHVVWFDPAHNMYPGKGNKPQEQASYAKVRSFSPEAVEEVRAINNRLVDEKNALVEEKQKLQAEFDELYAIFASTPGT